MKELKVVAHPVDIFFTASDAPRSKYLRAVTDGDVSHVGLLYFSLDFGAVWILEVSARGVWAVPFENFNYNIVKQYRCLFPTDKALLNVTRHIGKYYDYPGAFLFGAWLLIKKLFRCDIDRPWASPRYMWCSEFVAEFLRECNIDTKDPEAASPQDLLMLCKSRPHLFSEVQK